MKLVFHICIGLCLFVFNYSLSFAQGVAEENNLYQIPLNQGDTFTISVSPAKLSWI